MLKREVNLATIDECAMEIAEKYDLGIELDQFCTAMYMDPPDFETWDLDAKKYMSRARTFHGPFNELSPCAIDPKVKDVSMERYNQAFQIMWNYGIKRMVLHGGFVPRVYFPVWYIERSIIFWKKFLSDKPDDFVLYLENVMEPDPEYLSDIVKEINDPRCKLCYDCGHANAGGISQISPVKWMETVGPYLGHMHLHNNDGSWDLHKNLGEGNIPIDELLAIADELAPEAGITIENIDDTEQSVIWLQEREVI